MSFGYQGFVRAVDPTFAASLPPDSGIAVGAPVAVTYSFDSTTPDADPHAGNGVYPGTLQSWDLQVGLYHFNHDPAGGLNEIDVNLDWAALYEAIDNVLASPAIAGQSYLESDVLMVGAGLTPPLADDSLPVVQPNPTDVSWGQSDAGLFDINKTTLIDIDITASCTIPCSPPPPHAVPTTSPLALVAFLLLSGCLTLLSWRESRWRQER